MKDQAPSQDTLGRIIILFTRTIASCITQGLCYSDGSGSLSTCWVSPHQKKMALDRAYFRLTKRGPSDADLRPLVLRRIAEERLLYVDPAPAKRPRAMTAEMLGERVRVLLDLREGATLWVPGLARLGFSGLDIRDVMDLLFSTGRKCGDALSGTVYSAETPPLAVGAVVKDAEATLKREAMGRARAELQKNGAKIGRPTLSIAQKRQAIKEMDERDPRVTSAGEVAARWGVDKSTIYAWKRLMATRDIE